MRILLVEPPITPGDIGTGVAALPEPLALECIAACLPDHDVRILDMRLDGDLEREMESFGPRVVAAGGCTAVVSGVLRVLERAKAFDSKVITIAGGHHASLLPEDLATPFVDLVAIGEGEITFRDAVDALESGRPIEAVPGLAFRRSGSVVFTPERPLADLDALPFAARNLTDRYRRSYFRAGWNSLALLYTSRGCAFRCSFCAMWKLNRGACRRRSPARVVEEIAGLPEAFVDLVDDNTFADVRWAMSLRDLLLREGVRKKYKVYARSDVIARHPDLVRAWRDIGLEVALVGFESPRDDDLSRFNKRSTVEQNETAIRILKENDVEIAAYFVVDPEFSEEDFAELRAYVERWELLHPIFTVLTPFPGTDFFEGVKHRLTDWDYDRFDFFHSVLPTRLPRRDFYARFVDLYRHAYSLRRAIKYRKQLRVLDLSLRQVMLRRRFLKQLAGLKRTAA